MSARHPAGAMWRFVPALWGATLGLVALAALLIAGLGARAGVWHFSTGLRIATWAVGVAVLALVLSVTGIVRARRNAGQRGRLWAWLGACAALPVVVLAAQWELAARIYPPINDISTDTTDAPVFWDMPSPTDYPGGKTAELQRAGYPELVSRPLALPPDKAYAMVLALARDRGWTIVASVPQEGRLEATSTSLLYGFTDEVVLRVKASGAQSLVDMRSRSRVGRIDRGANARRIRAYLDDLEQLATTQP